MIIIQRQRWPSHLTRLMAHNYLRNITARWYIYVYITLYHKYWLSFAQTLLIPKEEMTTKPQRAGSPWLLKKLIDQMNIYQIKKVSEELVFYKHLFKGRNDHQTPQSWWPKTTHEGVTGEPNKTNLSKEAYFGGPPCQADRSHFHKAAIPAC